MGALKPGLLSNTKTDPSVTRDLRHRRLLTVTGVTGIAYTLSWVAGLAVAAPSPELTASGASITAALAGHQAAVVAQFALTEGLPAVGLAVISIALARAARRSGAAGARPGRPRRRPGGRPHLGGAVRARGRPGRSGQPRHRAPAV